MPISLLRALIDATGLSRRSAFAAIRAGRLTEDQVPTTDPSRPYAGGALALDGVALERSHSEKVYLLMHKPPGVIATVTDDRGRRTVLDLVPPPLRVPGLHPVGRLDRETTGLLLLTNDGAFTHRLTHPRFEVEKEYWLTTWPPLEAAQLQALAAGVEIEGLVRAPVAVSRLQPQTGWEVSITLREGRKRQVRRMIEAAGARVRRLRRVREGTLDLAGLPEGGVRLLTRAEVLRLIGS